MQEVNELKNLIIQGLESNGVLGQIRAQIRASVFQMVEKQEAATKKQSALFWENPQAQKVYDNPNGKVSLDIINDFLLFYRMDYTQSIFAHESNLRDHPGRENLSKKFGLGGDNTQPVIFQILNAIERGELVIKEKTPDTSFQENQKGAPSKKPDILAKKDAPNQTIAQETDQLNNHDAINPPPKPKKNYKSLSPQNASSRGDFMDFLDAEREKKALEKAKDKMKNAEVSNKLGELETQSKNLLAKNQVYAHDEDDQDDYGDEKFENIDEEVVEDPEEIDERGKGKNAYLTSSEDNLGITQSQGFDNSVDSMALEEYDFIEDAKRP